MPGHQAILERCGGTQLLNQEEAAYEQQQYDGDAHETLGLPLGDLVLRIVILPMVMCVHRTLPLGRTPSNSLGRCVEARQEAVSQQCSLWVFSRTTETLNRFSWLRAVECRVRLSPIGHSRRQTTVLREGSLLARPDLRFGRRLGTAGSSSGLVVPLLPVFA